MNEAVRIILASLSIFTALGVACAVRLTLRRGQGVGCRRRTGDNQVAADPYFHPFGEMPIVPRERLMIAGNFRNWGIPDKSPSAAVAHQRKENGGRPIPSTSSAVVLTFPAGNHDD
jgi:hypothetical protein